VKNDDLRQNLDMSKNKISKHDIADDRNKDIKTTKILDSFDGELISCLDQYISSANELESCRVELDKLMKVFISANAEKNDKSDSINKINKQISDGQITLNQKIKDLELKIKNLKAVYKSKKQQDEYSNGDEMKELKISIFSYEQHKKELSDRLSSGLVSDSILAKLHELQEDKEVLETEIDLEQGRITQERNKMTKLLDCFQHCKNSISNKLHSIESKIDFPELILFDLKKIFFEKKNSVGVNRLYEIIIKRLISMVLDINNFSSTTNTKVKQK
jgi:hypothetical protein